MLLLVSELVAVVLLVLVLCAYCLSAVIMHLRWSQCIGIVAADRKLTFVDFFVSCAACVGGFESREFVDVARQHWRPIGSRLLVPGCFEEWFVSVGRWILPLWGGVGESTASSPNIGSFSSSAVSPRKGPATC